MRARRHTEGPRRAVAWPCRGACLLLLGWVGVAVYAAPVVVVQGTQSTPNQAERNYAAGVTRRMSGWLSELGLTHRVVDDDELSATLLRGASVAILTYNPNLPAAERAVLKAFVQRGGRLVVFYSADPRLARLMGLKLGAYRADPQALRWTRMRFVEGALPGAPQLVYQRSRNIRPVTPRRKSGRVVAYWEDANGRQREPAWVRTRAGFWMTHVVRDDGDTWHKQQLLVAVLGALDATVWPVAARAARLRAETLGTFTSFAEAERVIRRRAPRTGRAGNAAAALAVVRQSRMQLDALLEGEQYAAALQQSDVLYRQLLQAYAATFDLRTLRLRGVWDHFGLGLYAGDWPRTCRELDAFGITDVFVNVLWPGRARFESDVLPVDDVVAIYGDLLAASIKAGHARGLKVHLWKVCWNLDGTSAALMARLRRAGRLQRRDDGAELPWLCPSHPANLRYEKDGLREALRRYPVDGVHLDYIRYPGSHACYCRGCRDRFEAHLERPVARWPEDVRKGVDRQAYTRWRCAQITRLVRDVSVLARKLRPGIRVSAAVFGKYPSCVDSVAQDWPAWVNAGLIDFVAPMNYTADHAAFVTLLTSQTALVDRDARLCPGIGVTAAESRLGVPAVLRQLEAAQQCGGGGFILFDLNEVLSREILPYIGMQ